MSRLVLPRVADFALPNARLDLTDLYRQLHNLFANGYIRTASSRSTIYRTLDASRFIGQSPYQHQSYGTTNHLYLINKLVRNRLQSWNVLSAVNVLAGIQCRDREKRESETRLVRRRASIDCSSYLQPTQGYRARPSPCADRLFILHIPTSHLPGRGRGHVSAFIPIIALRHAQTVIPAKRPLDPREKAMLASGNYV